VILIMTTNVGAHQIKNESGMGLPGAGDDQSFENMKERVFGEIEKAFRPEFLNRLEEPVIFRHLEKADLKVVVDFELSKIRRRLKEMGFDLDLNADAKEYLIKKGTNLDYGARPLRRALENFVEDPLSEELLKGTFEGKNRIEVVGVRNDEGKITELKFNSEFIEPPEPPAEEEPVGVGAGDGDDAGGGDDSSGSEE